MTVEQAHDTKLELALAATRRSEDASVEGPSPRDPGLDDATARDRMLHVSAEPRRLGRYVVLGTLGSGGMGTVLEAFDRTLDRKVAVKVLHRDLGQRQRLVREAQALAKLSHPHVVQVYEVGEADEGQVFVAMELVRGRSLAEWARQGPRPGWRECVQVYVQAGEGLAAAHAKGLVHRDFKPGNAVIDDEGRVRVLDFGLARQADDVEQERGTDTSAELDDAALATPLTRTGAVLGTLAYMPLEQMRGGQADARSDQFSFCVSLYEALHGERPFEGRSMGALMLGMTGPVRPAPQDSTVPEALRRVVLRGLAVSPDERWPSMDALLVELRRLVAPRRRTWWALGVAGGLAVVGLGLARYAEVGFRCEGARAQLDGIWDEARKQEVKTAILGTGLSYAADTWERVELRLDEHADAWAAKHTEVCEATSVRQEQSAEVMDLRMGCMRRRRIELREVVGVLAQADATRVQHAVKLVDALPGLPACDDVEALGAELPPPEDPQAATQVEALRERLVHVRALLHAGAFGDAVTAAEDVMAKAEGLAYVPLSAEALLARGEARESVARYEEAEQDAERAYSLAAEHGHAAVEVRAADRLVWIVGYRRARPDAGLAWGTTALALALGRRFEPELHAAALDDVGAVLARDGRFEAALDHFQRALVIGEQALGPRHLEVADSLNSIGVVLARQDRPGEALESFQRALAIREEALGPGHPDVASTRDNIGGVLGMQGKLDVALIQLERAQDIWEEALGPRHPDVARSLQNIGNVLADQGQPEAALTHYERALAIKEEVLGPDHPDVALSFDSMAMTLRDQGKLEAALTYYERALASRMKSLGPRHPDVADSLAGIGEVLGQQEKHGEALDYFERALAIREESLGAGHPDVARALHSIGDALLLQGRPAEARIRYERALAICEEALDPGHPSIPSALEALALAELVERDHEAARAHAERAVALREAVADASPELLAEARFLFARALQADGSQRTRARALAVQARDAYVALDDADAVAKVQAWLEEP